eukprot:6238663-Alexandrium_andersonii.AAC.1
MSASLVGSEMCIRDRGAANPWSSSDTSKKLSKTLQNSSEPSATLWSCLLYTSDAADDISV